MKTTQSIFLLSILSIMHFTSFAQKQTFDIVSYTPPEGWTESTGNGNVSYSRIENGNWAQIAIYKSTVSAGSIDADFDNDWNELVAVNKNISSPEKAKTQSAYGWTIMSGSGNWTYNGANVTSLLSVYSNGQLYISVVYNSTAEAYLSDYKELLSSLTFSANDNSQSDGSSAVANNTSVVGIWVVNHAETRGFTNGFLMYSGGYMRKEYQIKEDGSYIFREKDWLANNETIYFVYESGTWTMDRNKLIITPKKGKAGWWNKDKVTNDVNKWGNYQKTAAYKTQTTEYTVEIKIDPNYGNSIILNCSKATERDGGQLNNPPYRFVYVQRKESLIDNPPAFKF